MITCAELAGNICRTGDINTGMQNFKLWHKHCKIIVDTYKKVFHYEEELF
jgi:hypothetical protein